MFQISLSKYYTKPAWYVVKYYFGNYRKTTTTIIYVYMSHIHI